MPRDRYVSWNGTIVGRDTALISTDDPNQVEEVVDVPKPPQKSTLWTIMKVCCADGGGGVGSSEENPATGRFCEEVGEGDCSG